jgi:hypothetical protein
MNGTEKILLPIQTSHIILLLINALYNAHRAAG